MYFVIYKISTQKKQLITNRRTGALNNFCNVSILYLDVIHLWPESCHLLTTLLQHITSTEHSSVVLHSLLHCQAHFSSQYITICKSQLVNVCYRGFTSILFMQKWLLIIFHLMKSGERYGKQLWNILPTSLYIKNCFLPQFIRIISVLFPTLESHLRKFSNLISWLVLLCNSMSASSAKYNKIKQRIGSQSVGSVDRCTSCLSSSIKAWDYLVTLTIIGNNLKELNKF